MEVGGRRHGPAAVFPGKRRGTHLQEAGWAPSPVWTKAENLVPTGIRFPDLPARSELLYLSDNPEYLIIRWRLGHTNQ
jgi:hypothetical protein